MNPLAKLMNLTLNMTDRALASKRTSAPNPNAETKCVCAECKKLFPLVAVAICPQCGSRQIRRADALEIQADALALELATATGTLEGSAQTLKDLGLPKVAQLLLKQAASANAALNTYRAARAARN